MPATGVDAHGSRTGWPLDATLPARRVRLGIGPCPVLCEDDPTARVRRGASAHWCYGVVVLLMTDARIASRTRSDKAQSTVPFNSLIMVMTTPLLAARMIFAASAGDRVS